MNQYMFAGHFPLESYDSVIRLVNRKLCLLNIFNFILQMETGVRKMMFKLCISIQERATFCDSLPLNFKFC